MSSMSRVLALDTATDACTLALCGEGDLRARHERLARAHNRHILGMLTDILAERSLASAVDVIACGVGPGSFTGLRVAVSASVSLSSSSTPPLRLSDPFALASWSSTPTERAEASATSSTRAKSRPPPLWSNQASSSLTARPSRSCSISDAINDQARSAAS